MRSFTNPIELISYLDTLGLTFRNAGTGSYYCNERRIRISDHFSKYTERMAEVFKDDTALDIVFVPLSETIYTEEDIKNLLNKDNEWYFKFYEGCNIEHKRKERVGELKFISFDIKKETVKCMKEDGSIVEYFQEMIKVI